MAVPGSLATGDLQAVVAGEEVVGQLMLPALTAADYRDDIHINPQGQQRYAAAIAQLLQ